jgi:hypothetical protein
MKTEEHESKYANAFKNDALCTDINICSVNYTYYVNSGCRVSNRGPKLCM